MKIIEFTEGYTLRGLLFFFLAAASFSRRSSRIWARWRRFESRLFWWRASTWPPFFLAICLRVFSSVFGILKFCWFLWSDFLDLHVVESEWSGNFFLMGLIGGWWGVEAIKIWPKCLQLEAKAQSQCGKSRWCQSYQCIVEQVCEREWNWWCKEF